MYTQKFYESIKADENNIHSDLFFELEEIINKIKKEFKPYFEIYTKIRNNIITEDEGIKLLRDKLFKFNGQQLNDLNEFTKMYSTTNCSWQEYQLAQIIHYMILELFNDEDYTYTIKKELNKYN